MTTTASMECEHDGDCDVPKALVVPVDGSRLSERALGVGRALAVRLGAELVLVTSGWASDEPGRTEYLARLAAARPDIATTTRFVTNRTPTDAIAEVAAERERSLVCMSTHGRGRVRWAIAGSVAEGVLRRCVAPMIAVGPHCTVDWPRSLERLMLCVDGSSATDVTVPITAAWARALDADVVVAEAIHPLDTETAEHGDPALDAIVAQLATAGLRARGDLVRASSFFAGALADHAADIDAALIVTSSHRRGGAARLALGSVTIATVALAPCPVLIVPKLTQ